MKPIILIPARKGSKRIPNKNFREFCGKPLIDWTVDQALEAGLGPVYISTDRDMESTGKYEVLRRPEYLSTDVSPMGSVISHVRERLWFYGPIILLQPTSPLRSVSDILESWSLYRWGSMVISSRAGTYTPNGAVYITENDLSTNVPCFVHEMPLSRSVDINTEDDWRVAECLKKNFEFEP